MSSNFALEKKEGFLFLHQFKKQLNEVMKQFYSFTLFLCLSVASFAQITIKDGSLQANGTYTWTSDNEYLLDGFVFLEAGATLNIEAGTLIKGKEIPTTGDNASALIITRNATINAIGTKDAPIIFTAEIDDINDDTDLLPTDRGLWGGLIILGNGKIADDACEQSVEGLPPGDTRAIYGNPDCSEAFATESSGVLNYISIRHGGTEIGAGNEINGITLAGVGSGTNIDFVEVFANLDDGIEWFGGSANVKHAAVSFCGDDGMDYDHRWVGNGQFWFVLTDADGDNGGEHDGASPDENPQGYSNPTIYNATYIGAGAAGSDIGILFRDNTAGTYGNSIITNYENGLEIEDIDGDVDAYNHFTSGELRLNNNIWFGFQSTLFKDTPNGAMAIFTASGNTEENPQLGGISHTADGGLNPIPNIAGAAYSNVAAVPDDTFFVAAPYKGAFCDQGAWIADWTALAQMGILDPSIPFDDSSCDMVAVEDLLARKMGYKLEQNTPNPFSGHTKIEFELPISTNISISIYNIDGKRINTLLDNERLMEGKHSIDFNANALPKGIYFYVLQNAEVVITQKMIVE